MAILLPHLSYEIVAAEAAEADGADAILSVMPYYNKPMQAGILAHFQAIAGVTVILHDVPSRTMREVQWASGRYRSGPAP